MGQLRMSPSTPSVSPRGFKSRGTSRINTLQDDSVSAWWECLHRKTPTSRFELSSNRCCTVLHYLTRPGTRVNLHPLPGPEKEIRRRLDLVVVRDLNNRLSNRPVDLRQEPRLGVSPHK